jgi:hypothetical protein
MYSSFDMTDVARLDHMSVIATISKDNVIIFILTVPGILA